jgi:hypothetical protein
LKRKKKKKDKNGQKKKEKKSSKRCQKVVKKVVKKLSKSCQKNVKKVIKKVVKKFPHRDFVLYSSEYLASFVILHVHANQIQTDLLPQLLGRFSKPVGAVWAIHDVYEGGPVVGAAILESVSPRSTNSGIEIEPFGVDIGSAAAVFRCRAPRWWNPGGFGINK